MFNPTPCPADEDRPRSSVAIYDSDRSIRPRQKGSVEPDKFLKLLTQHSIRPNKSGRAFAPHQLREGGSRRNADVVSISMLTADSDNGVPLRELTERFAGLKAAIYTTHSHTPENPKARVVAPLLRPVPAQDWPAFLEGAKARFGADIFDPATKDLARQYYLPSCPPETAEHRHAEIIEGDLLDPQPLIVAGREVLAPATLASAPGLLANAATSDEWSSGRAALPDPETPENVERLRAAAATIPAAKAKGCTRDIYRNVIWAIASTGWGCAEEIARGWCMTSPEDFNEEHFRKDWLSYDAARADRIGVGSVFKLAEQYGWVDPRGSVREGSSQEIDDTMRGASGDIANGRLFANLYRGKKLFVHESGDMLEFAAVCGWSRAAPGEAERAAKAAIAALRGVAAERYKKEPDAPKTKRLMAHVERSSTAQKIAAMISMAKSEPGMTVQLHQLDADPLMLGVENGVFDLRTCTLLPTSPDLLVTKRCAVAYAPTETAPVWEAFINRISGGSASLARFLQRLAGYLLTGDVGEQCFAFLYGLGRNGKTTYAEALRWLLGDYAVILPTSTLMIARRDPGAASPDLMLLKGARLALANETEESARLAESVVKSLTGGDSITARDPYGKFATWNPTHKLMLVGNHRPVIAGGDWGIWRRVRLVPFTETISDHECDPQLPEKIRAEGSGLLNWCLDGYRAWRREGLNPPPEVRGAGDEYRKDMDIVGQWVEEHTEVCPGGITPTADLYRAYVWWSRSSGWHPMTRQSFGRRLAERGVQIRKAGASSTKCAIGLKLNREGVRAMTE